VFLRRLRSIKPHTRVIIVTDESTPEDVIASMREHAFGYLSKGFSLGKLEATDASGTTIGTFEALAVAEYVEIPLLARIGLVNAGPVRPALVLGPTIGFKVRERLKLTGAVNSSSASDRFASTDMGLTGGAEVRFRTGPGWSLLEARYTLGMTNVVAFLPPAPGAWEAKNRALTVMAGYAF
jgi:hypothetical protein